MPTLTISYSDCGHYTVSHLRGFRGLLFVIFPNASIATCVNGFCPACRSRFVEALQSTTAKLEACLLGLIEQQSEIKSQLRIKPAGSASEDSQNRQSWPYHEAGDMATGVSDRHERPATFRTPLPDAPRPGQKVNSRLSPHSSSLADHEIVTNGHVEADILRWSPDIDSNYLSWDENVDGEPLDLNDYERDSRIEEVQQGAVTAEGDWWNESYSQFGTPSNAMIDLNSIPIPAIDLRPFFDEQNKIRIDSEEGRKVLDNLRGFLGLPVEALPSKIRSFLANHIDRCGIRTRVRRKKCLRIKWSRHIKWGIKKARWESERLAWKTWLCENISTPSHQHSRQNTSTEPRGEVCPTISEEVLVHPWWQHVNPHRPAHPSNLRSSRRYASTKEHEGELFHLQNGPDAEEQDVWQDDQPMADSVGGSSSSQSSYQRAHSSTSTESDSDLEVAAMHATYHDTDGGYSGNDYEDRESLPPRPDSALDIRSPVQDWFVEADEIANINTWPEPPPVSSPIPVCDARAEPFLTRLRQLLNLEFDATAHEVWARMNLEPYRELLGIALLGPLDQMDESLREHMLMVKQIVLGLDWDEVQRSV